MDVGNLGVFQKPLQPPETEDSGNDCVSNAVEVLDVQFICNCPVVGTPVALFCDDCSSDCEFILHRRLNDPSLLAYDSLIRKFGTNTFREKFTEMCLCLSSAR
jgi:hypothetical protein